jgi:hypothetical protein
MSQSSPLRQRLHAWLSGNAGDHILRWIFRSVVVVTIAVLAADLATTNGWISNPDPGLTPAEAWPASPELGWPNFPSILAPLLPGGDKRLVPLPQPEGAWRSR